jgi:sensor histidine kinase YesM
MITGMDGLSSGKGWFFRYKLYHLPFWFVYHFVWWTVTVGSPLAVASNIVSSVYSVKYCFYVIFQAIGVYFNLYFLIPRFLEKGRYGMYLLLLLLTVLCTATLVVPGYYVSAWFSEQSFRELYGRGPEEYMYFFNINALPSAVASTTLGMSIKLTKSWMQSRRREEALEKEKLETELKFLRSQFNPHFLFNTINSIFVLIHKNPVMASESLAKFSDILRYQLYECNENCIPLGQELNYLENFIELQRLRQDHDRVDLTLRYNVQHTEDLEIAPFVLMPFVENAFKHVSRRSDAQNRITLDLSLAGDELLLLLSNSVCPGDGGTELIHYGGIGLKNVQRRLDLLYPGRHQLTITRDEKIFHVALRVALRERVVAGGAGLGREHGLTLIPEA